MSTACRERLEKGRNLLLNMNLIDQTGAQEIKEMTQCLSLLDPGLASLRVTDKS